MDKIIKKYESIVKLCDEKIKDSTQTMDNLKKIYKDKKTHPKI